MRDRYDQNECASVAISIILTISIEQQVVTGNACLDIVRRCLDIFHCVSCGNMLHSNFQCWEVSNKWLHDLLDEYGFSIEDVSLGDFRMDAEHHLVLVQFLQNLIALSNIRDSHVTVCCCTNWIVLASDYTTGLCGFYNFFRFRLVGQVQRHKWFHSSSRVWWQRFQYVLLVLECLFSSYHRWLQVGHYEASSKALGSMCENRSRL